MAESEKKLNCIGVGESNQEGMHSPLVSVVVPVYNVEDYLRECLDSVVHQTYKNLEIIVVDDGSTDSSGSICDVYEAEDDRVRVIHKANGGLGNARNVGMDVAGGKYIIFLDSDDYWELNTVEVLCSVAERDSLQVLVFSAEPFWDGMEQPEKYLDYGHAVQNGAVKTGPESMKAAMDNKEYYSQACMRFYLLSYLRENGFRFDEGIIHEDESFSFLAYLCADRVECLEDRLYKRRFRPGSIMTTRTLQKSSLGYAGALNTLLNYYQARFDLLSELERELFVRQMKLYIRVIYSAYGKMMREDRRKHDMLCRNAHVITKNTRYAMWKARILNPYMTRELRISTYSLWAGYWVPRVATKVKHFIQR